jgi:hypothetical protein
MVDTMPPLRPDGTPVPDMSQMMPHITLRGLRAYITWHAEAVVAEAHGMQQMCDEGEE